MTTASKLLEKFTGSKSESSPEMEKIKQRIDILRHNHELNIDKLNKQRDELHAKFDADLAALKDEAANQRDKETGTH